MVEFINNICRVCLSSENELQNIESEFIVEDKPFHLETVLLQIGGIEIKGNSELPSSICNYCLDEAIVANKFRQKCRNSNKTLQQFLKQAQGLTDGDIESRDTRIIPVTKQLMLLCRGNNVKVEVKKLPGTKKVDCSRRPVKSSVINHGGLTGGQVMIQTKSPLCDDVLLTPINKYYTKSIQPNEHCYESSLSRYKCNMCYDVFSDETELISHLRIKHTIAQYQCKLCSELFETSVGVQIHMAVHKQAAASAAAARVKQENALRILRTMDDYREPDKKELVCHICSKAYKDRTGFVRHIQFHEDGRIHTSYVCDYCGKSFRSRHKLQIHITWFHLQQKEHQCALCEKKFKTKKHLRSHQITHTKIKSFSCSICGMGLSNKSSLLQHERTHNDVRPYKCDECDRAFVCTARRNMHKLTAHTKPTKKCPRCPATFHLNAMVNRHIKKVHLKADRRRKQNTTTQSIEETFNSLTQFSLGNIQIYKSQ